MFQRENQWEPYGAPNTYRTASDKIQQALMTTDKTQLQNRNTADVRLLIKDIQIKVTARITLSYTRTNKNQAREKTIFHCFDLTW